MIVKNEKNQVLEWIAYHLVLGFDAVLVLDNESDDGTSAILAAAELASGGAVHHIPWPSVGVATQNDGYQMICSRFAREYNWIAFLDVDEFLVPAPAASLTDWLDSHPEAAAIGVNWLFFGSSGHEAVPDGLMIEAFQHRGTADFMLSGSSFMPNRLIKSIVRPERVNHVRNPHAFDVAGPIVDPQGRTLETEDHGSINIRTPPDVLPWRVHHYFVRSRAQWEAKLARGYWDDTKRDLNAFDAYDRNEVHDPAALAFASATRHKMRELAG